MPGGLRMTVDAGKDSRVEQDDGGLAQRLYRE